MSTRVAINDANILIDLVKTGLLEASLKLPIVYHTTNIIFAELHPHQQHLFEKSIQKGHYQIIEISLEEINEIYELVPLDRTLSEQDWSAYYYAKKWDCLLLTGDNRLRSRALTSGIKVHGILWILDELLAHHHINQTDAFHLLQQLMTINRRLPQSECLKRLERWKYPKSTV